MSITQRWVLIFFIAGLCLTTGCVSTCQKTSKPRVSAPDINNLRVAVTPNAPPLNFKHGTAIVGLEADLDRDLSKY